LMLTPMVLEIIAQGRGDCRSAAPPTRCGRGGVSRRVGVVAKRLGEDAPLRAKLVRLQTADEAHSRELRK